MSEAVPGQSVQGLVAGKDNPGEDLWKKGFLWLARTLPSCVFCPADPGRRVVADLAARAADGHWVGDDSAFPHAELIELIASFGLTSPKFTDVVLESSLPCIAVMPGQGPGIVRERLKTGQWLFETAEGSLRRNSFAPETTFLSFEGVRHHDNTPPATARELLYGIFFARKGWIVQLFTASFLASFLLLGTSLYSMQVYDRVVAHGGIPTLVVLTIGVSLAIGVEFLLKLARMAISHAALAQIEIEMATRVFQVMLGIRLEAFPARLGGLAAQLRGFEAIKTFLAARTTFLFCEFPFSLFFLAVVYLLGGVAVALVPAVSLALAVLCGLLFKRRIHHHARRERGTSRNRQGHLIETLRNIELVKAHGAGWRMQGSWNALTRAEVTESNKTRAAGEVAAALGASIQQISYIGLVATGAWLAVGESMMTTGSIVACSILSGRIFAPIAKLPSLLVQWGHAEEALATLETLFERHRDHGDTERPLLVSTLEGSVELREITFAYAPRSPRIALPHLRIDGGEKVAILGRVGAGKSTLLKMIAGLIRPATGQVLIDGLDVFSLAAERRAESIAYLSQSPGLIQGTIRENLLMGQTSISDEALLTACAQSGLADILATREQGLETPIHEGGAGFSGGQIQLIALTRLLLVTPRLWLLDEPTSALDSVGEQRALAFLKQAVGKKNTLVLVTHKLPPLELVDRVIVIDGQQILADGPKAQVLETGGR